MLKLHERQGGLHCRVAGGAAHRKPPGFGSIWSDGNLNIRVIRNKQRVMNVCPQCRGGTTPHGERWKQRGEM